MPRTVPLLRTLCPGNGSQCSIGRIHPDVVPSSGGVQEAPTSPQVSFKLAAVHEVLRRGGQFAEQFLACCPQSAHSVASHLESLGYGLRFSYDFWIERARDHVPTLLGRREGEDHLVGPGLHETHLTTPTSCGKESRAGRCLGSCSVLVPRRRGSPRFPQGTSPRGWKGSSRCP